MIVMPFSRSRSIESIIRSATVSFWRKRPDCHSMASTSVVLPWSTWAMMAMFRIDSRVSIRSILSPDVPSGRLRRAPVPRGSARRSPPPDDMYNDPTRQPAPGGPVKRLHFIVFLGLAPLLAIPTLVAAQAKAPTAVITLEKSGEITIELFPADAPKTVESFVKLARDGFYDGTTFHRVIPGFVAQAGDPLSKSLPAGDPRLGTGGRGPDSAGSQFYITLGPAPHLDGQYTVFGRVTSGMNVVDSIKIGDRIKTIKIVG